MKAITAATGFFGLFLGITAWASTLPAPDEPQILFSVAISPGAGESLERIRIARDIPRWKLHGLLFDQGPSLPGIADPVLAGPESAIAVLEALPDVTVQRHGPVRGYRELCPGECSRLSPENAPQDIIIDDGYHNQDQQALLLGQFETNYPAIARRIAIGTTHLGRPIWTLKISDNVAVDEQEPAVAFDGNIHAREYVPPEVCLDIIDLLLKGYGSNPEYTAWIDNLEIYVTPCLNPDGRFLCETYSSSWRKNARDNNNTGTNSFTSSDGVDLNRNADFLWGSDNNGSSPNIYDDDYRGPWAASEPETQAYCAFLRCICPAFHLTMHSYWNLYYGAYGDYTHASQPLPDPIHPLGNQIAAASTGEYGAVYQMIVGPEMENVDGGYPVNGDLSDWCYNTLGTFSLGVEIGDAGFQPSYSLARNQLVLGLRGGWKKILAAAYNSHAQWRGRLLDLDSGQPVRARITLPAAEMSAPNGEHFENRPDGRFNCVVRTNGLWHFIVQPIGQPELTITQAVTLASGATEQEVNFRYCPDIRALAESLQFAWTNGFTNGLIQVERNEALSDEWIPDQAFASTSRVGQALLGTAGTTPVFRVRAFSKSDAPGNMAVVPAGDFYMGDTTGQYATNELPVRRVSQDGFAIDQAKVSSSLWTTVRAWALTNRFANIPTGRASSSTGPVTSISWYDSLRWCNARSLRDRLDPVYYTNASLTMPFRGGSNVPAQIWVKWTASGYRLPTESEWEKAARGGFTGRVYPGGEAIASSPNGYGLYDYAGDAGEWCWDWMGGYDPTNTVNPKGVASGALRVVRGGSTNSFRCSSRAGMIPSGSNTITGLRCLRLMQ